LNIILEYLNYSKLNEKVLILIKSLYAFVMLNLTAIRQVLFQHRKNLTKEDSETSLFANRQVQNDDEVNFA